MKKESMITILLVVSSLVVAAAIFAGTFMEDRKAPEIRFDQEELLTYHTDESRENLLKGVKAVDDRDGDVTDSLRVSNLYRLEDERAVVVYAAKDQANNVKKVSRKIKYILAPKASNSIEQTAESSGETETSGTEERTAAKPVLKMLQKEVTKKQGESFSILPYIESAKDIDGTDLSKRIHVDGTFHMNVPGVYTLSVYAIGADRQQSNVENFILTVESAEENE